MFRRQEERIIGAGLNLALPPDGLGQGEGVCFQNWRVDTAGSLRSRQDAIVTAYSFVGSSYCDQITRIANERYYLDSAAGKLFSQAGTGGATSVLASGLDANGTGLLGYQGFVWIMNRASGKQLRYTQGGSVDDWTPAAPGSAPTLGDSNAANHELVEGETYWYWVTFVRGDGYESNPSSRAEITIGGGNNTVTITRPNASGWTPTGWHVYRQGNTMSAPYRVTLTPILYATGTFDDPGSDDFTDAEVTRRGFALEDNHDPAPQCSGIGLHYERVVAWGSSTYPNRLYYTDTRKPWYFPNPDEVNGNWVDVGELDEIVTCTFHPGHIRIYCKRSVWRLRGDFSTGVLERTNADLGLIGRQAICSMSGTDYFQGQEGIYGFNGDTVRPISRAVAPLFRLGVAYSGGATPSAAINGDEAIRGLHCIAIKNGRLFFSYCSGSNTTPDSVLTCDLATETWASETAPGSTGWTAMLYEGQYSDLLGATTSMAGPLIYALEQSYGVTTKPLKYISAYRNQGTNDRVKRYADLRLSHSVARSVTNARSLTVKLKPNNGVSSDLTLGSISVATTGGGDERLETTLPIPSSSDYEGYEARNAAVLIEGSSEYETVIFDAAIHYYLEPRDALSYDTGPIDLERSWAKSLELLWLDINTTDTLTWKVYTDLPNSTMVQRATGTLNALSGRAAVPIDVTAGTIGRLVRVTLTSPGTFRLYGLRLRYRQIGTYLYAGQVWKTSRVRL